MNRTCSTETGYQKKQAASLEAFQQGKIPLGRLIQEMREAKGWTWEQLGKLYGQALRDKPVLEGTIQRMEQTNNLPDSKKCRYVLAKLLDIPLALLGFGYAEQSTNAKKVTTHALNLVEYRATLDSYWNEHHTGTAQNIMLDVKKRIHKLHDVFPFTYTPEKSQMIELLCGFNIVVGNIERDQQHYQAAMKHLDNAVIVARENKCYDFYAAALHDRGVIFLDKGQTMSLNNDSSRNVLSYFAHALRDLNAAAKVEQTHHLPPFLQGYILTATGITQSHLAQDNQDLTEALTSIDKAERLIGQEGSEENKYFIMDTTKFGEDEYLIDRVSTLLGASTQKLRNPDKVITQLAFARKNTNSSLARRNAFIDIQSAKAYFDKGEYPMATKLALDAIAVVGVIESWVNIARVSRLYGDLKESSYGDSFEVAQLGVELMRLEHPNIFN